MPKSKITLPPGRLTILPPTKTLEDIVTLCDRHCHNALMQLLDCADCQDCTDSEIQLISRYSAEWAELRTDVLTMIEKSK